MRRARVSIRFEDWPAADQALWAALVRTGNPLDEAGGFSHMKATTLFTIRYNYARWLAWLRDSNPCALSEPPERRATPERLLAWMGSMSDLAPRSRATFVDGPIQVLSAAAPELDWRPHYRVRNRVQQEASRTDSTRKVGRVKSTAVLLEAGLELAGPRADAAATELEAMTHRRNGAMIAFLAMLPIRRRAFAGLELGRSVLVGPQSIDIVLSFDMTKTGVPWEAAVPKVIMPLLRRHIDEVQPYFLSRGSARHGYLWTDSKGKPLELNYLTQLIGRATQEMTGAWITPHLFRDAAATSLARLSPQHAALIRPLLGHQDFDTADRHYIQASSIEAGGRYASVIERLKENDPQGDWIGEV